MISAKRSKAMTLYSVKVPMKRIAPEVVSLIMNMNGWSQVKLMTASGPGEVVPFITWVVTAAALLPSSSTSITDFCIVLST